MGTTGRAITIPDYNTARSRTYPVQQLDHRRKFAHNIPLILLCILLPRSGMKEAGPHPRDAIEKAMKGVDTEQLKAWKTDSRTRSKPLSAESVIR